MTAIPTSVDTFEGVEPCEQSFNFPPLFVSAQCPAISRS